MADYYNLGTAGTAVDRMFGYTSLGIPDIDIPFSSLSKSRITKTV